MILLQQGIYQKLRKKRKIILFSKNKATNETLFEYFKDYLVITNDPRKIPKKIQVSPDDLEELTAKAEPEVDVDPELEAASEEPEVSLDQISEAETEAETDDTAPEDTEANS